MDLSSFANDIEQAIYYASRILLYPVLVAALACLIWVVVELGWFAYEVYLRVRYRDLDEIESRAVRARRALEQGRPTQAYELLQENRYSLVVAKFIHRLIRSYQMNESPVKPLKLLQESEFSTMRRLEKTRILVRVGPMLGLMGTLIPLAPALTGLAKGDTQTLAENLTIAFSVTVLGLLIGGLAFVVSIVRDRMYAQDISDLEYMLEVLHGAGPRAGAGDAPAARRGPAAAATEEEATES